MSLPGEESVRLDGMRGRGVQKLSQTDRYGDLQED
jgi:hypothetical protein